MASHHQSVAGEIAATITPCSSPSSPSPTVARRVWPRTLRALPSSRCSEAVAQGRHRNRPCPDDEEAIAATLQGTNEGADLILTVGGTGLGPRDRTPEATLRVIDRKAPGIAEAMRSRGAESNPYAWLSRGVAGLRGTTLIVNLPGSKRGAEESLAAILPLLRHGLEVAAEPRRTPEFRVTTSQSIANAYPIPGKNFPPNRIHLSPPAKFLKLLINCPYFLTRNR